MVNVLKWTDRAIEEYDKLVDYLYAEWGDRNSSKSCKGNSSNNNTDTKFT